MNRHTLSTIFVSIRGGAGHRDVRRYFLWQVWETTCHLRRTLLIRQLRTPGGDRPFPHTLTWPCAARIASTLEERRLSREKHTFVSSRIKAIRSEDERVSTFLSFGGWG